MNIIILHKELIEVPDLVGKNLNEAYIILEDLNLEGKVIDSIYYEGKEQSSVLETNPSSGKKITKGRTIFLTINSISVPKVQLVSVYNMSEFEATQILTVKKFKVEVRYKEDIVKDAVLFMIYNRDTLSKYNMPKIKYGSKIVLVVGKGLVNESLYKEDSILLND